MREALLTLLGAIVQYLLAPGVVAAGVLALLNKISTGRIDRHFTEKLKKFEHDLWKASAEIQLDHQRKLQDFTLYTSKRHELYADLFAMCRQVADTIRDLGLLAKMELDESDMAPAQIRDLFFTLGMDSDEIEQQVQRINTAGSNRRKLVKQLAHEYVVRESHAQFWAFMKRYRAHELYLSEDVRLRLGTFSHAVNEQLQDHSKTQNSVISEAIEQLRIQMRNEIAIGDHASIASVVRS